MNPIERDLKSYFGIEYGSADDTLEHYGTKRHSGRYPWGSGKTPYQHSGDFLSRVEQLKAKGLKENDILEAINDTLPDEYKLGATEFRVARTKAGHDRKASQYDQIKKLKEENPDIGWTEIGRRLDMSESSVRSMYQNGVGTKKDQAEKIAYVLKKEVDKKGMIDISEGTNLNLGVSEGKMDEAVYILEAEHGYKRYGVGIKQPTNPRQQTNITVLAKPEYDQKYAYQHQDDIQSLGDYHSDDGGSTFRKLQPPSSISSDRVAIRYGDEGGLAKDGVMEIRRGVPDLDLGNSHYAQVRIMVDNSHYLKGMAMYSDNLPDGVDIMFNTNKPSGTPKMKVLKPVKEDPGNPFGAAITAEGQSTYIGSDGKEHLSPINKLKWEGDWDDMSKSVSSQFLSKQPVPLIKKQLNLTMADYKAEYDEIMHYTNPTVKKKMLIDFADKCDGTSMTLKASAFPGQATKVILPLDKISEKEAYCPTYENGTQLALIRYPHAGTFEIPIVTVNNKNTAGKNNLGNVRDAIGISSKVAERLSGADFDGDTVMAIPMSDKVRINSTDPLPGLKNFDPKVKYAVPEGNPNNVRLMKKDEKQKEMGIISNLITDMTLRGADVRDLERAVKHSMVVIDAEKHGLDYKRSEQENNIQELKQKYQIRVDEDGNEKYGGASTLLSRRKQTVRIPERRGSVRIDKDTGEFIYKESGRTYKDKKGKEQVATTEVSRISLTKDVHDLSSGTPQEELYADFSNSLKAMANQARKEAVNMKGIQRDPEAAKKYAPEVASLKAKYEAVLANKPKERRAMIIANSRIKAIIEDRGLDRNNKEDKKEIKKISAVEMNRAREQVGAHSSKTKIVFSDREWEAIQNHAISDSMLTKFLNSSDSSEIVKRAMPKASTTLSPAKIAKAKAMYGEYTYKQIAEDMGVPLSTIYDALNK